MTLPDLDSLRCFEAAASHLNFRVAAKAVGLSPTAFSERIKRLEDQLGTKLFERTTRRVWLTPAGKRLTDRARQTLALARQCAEVVRDEGPAGVALHIGTRFELGLSWLVPQLAQLEQNMPGRTIHVHFGNGPDLLAEALQGRIDAVISSARLTEPEVKYAKLHEEAYAFVAAPSVFNRHPIAGPDDAAPHTLLDTNQSLPLFRYFLDAVEAEDVWQFEHMEFLGTIAAMRYRVLEGAGVAVLPAYFIGPDLEVGDMVQIMPEVKMRSDWFRLIWRAQNPLEDQLLALAEELRAEPLR